MSALIIPDVHQKKNWKYALEHADEFDKIFFLGDYFDHHGDADFYDQEAITNFEEIVAFKEKYPDKVELCFGNHDAHYLGGFGTYSSWQFGNADAINGALLKAANYLNICYDYNGFIISHAGITKTWYKASCDKVESLKNHWKNGQPPSILENPIDSINSWLKEILKYNVLLMDDAHYHNLSEEERGNFVYQVTCLSRLFDYPRDISDHYGDDPLCSPIWVRPYSLLNDALFEKQIVGHSATEVFFKSDEPVALNTGETKVIFLDNINHDNLFVLDNTEISWRELA